MYKQPQAHSLETVVETANMITTYINYEVQFLSKNFKIFYGTIISISSKYACRYVST